MINYQSKASFIRPLTDEAQQPAHLGPDIVRDLDGGFIKKSKNKLLMGISSPLYRVFTKKAESTCIFTAGVKFLFGVVPPL